MSHPPQQPQYVELNAWLQQLQQWHWQSQQPGQEEQKAQFEAYFFSLPPEQQHWYNDYCLAMQQRQQWQQYQPPFQLQQQQQQPFQQQQQYHAGPSYQPRSAGGGSAPHYRGGGPAAHSHPTGRYPPPAAAASGAPPHHHPQQAAHEAYYEEEDFDDEEGTDDDDEDPFGEIDEVFGDTYTAPSAAAGAATRGQPAATTAMDDDATSLLLARSGSRVMITFCDRKSAPATIMDVSKRTLLHCAVDADAVELVNYLLSHGATGRERDENDMTPVELAVLLRHEASLKALKDHCGAAVEVPSWEDVALKYQKEPPAFSFLKSVPLPAPAPGEHPFFHGQAPRSALNPPHLTVAVCPPEAEFTVESAWYSSAVTAATTATTKVDDTFGVLQTKITALSSTNGSIPIVVAAADDESNIRGIVLARRPGSLKLSAAATTGATSLQSRPVICFSHLVSAERASTHRALNAASTLCTDDSIAWFFSPRMLPVRPAATVKVHRRVLQPHDSFKKHAVAAKWMPLLAKNDNWLRVDTILRQAVRPLPAGTGLVWQDINAAPHVTDPAMLATVAESATPKDALVSLEFTAEHALAIFAFSQDSCFVAVTRREGTGEIESAVAFRYDRDADSGLVVATVVAAYIPSKPLDDRLAEISRAAVTMGVHVLHVASVAGISDKDLRVNFFEEVPELAHFLYLINAEGKPLLKTVEVGSKIHVPFLA